MVVAFSTSLAHKHARPTQRIVQNGLMCIDVTETSDEPKSLLDLTICFSIFFQEQPHFKESIMKVSDRVKHGVIIATLVTVAAIVAWHFTGKQTLRKKG
jgi:hypothetical protein